MLEGSWDLVTGALLISGVITMIIIWIAYIRIT